MAKFCLKKPSKRMQARKRYKIEKKVREHNRKKRKEAKLNAKKKPKMITIPNECPFKEDIIREAEALKKQKEEERQKHREEMKQRKKEAKELKKNGSVETSTEQTENKSKDKITSLPIASESKDCRGIVAAEVNLVKPHFTDCKNALQSADVVLEVLDARDPLGTRCQQVEDTVLKDDKKMIIILNKADLVPKENLEKWLQYFRQRFPTIAFRSVTYREPQKIAKAKKKKLTVNNEDIISGESIGNTTLRSMLKNYCSNKNAKKSISVSVLGLPNVGKSSVINSLKNSKICCIGNSAGVTKTIQVVQLDSKIKILDTPGIMFDDLKQEHTPQLILKNVVRPEIIKDYFNPVTHILKMMGNKQIVEKYDVFDFKTNEEFFEKLAKRNGLLKKGGIPDIAAAARIVLNDWNSGKLRFHTSPPKKASSNLSEEVVNKLAKEFEFEKLIDSEKEVLDKIALVNTKNAIKSLVFKSSGPVSARILIEQEKKQEEKQQKRKINEDEPKDAPKRTKKEQQKTATSKRKTTKSDDYSFESDYLL